MAYSQFVWGIFAFLSLVKEVKLMMIKPFFTVSTLRAQIRKPWILLIDRLLVPMPSQADMIQTIKMISEQVMESLKALLLLLVTLAEVHSTPQQVPEERSQQLNGLLTEVQQQRARIEEISQILRNQSPRRTFTTTPSVMSPSVLAGLDSDLEWELASNATPSLVEQGPVLTQQMMQANIMAHNHQTLGRANRVASQPVVPIVLLTPPPVISAPVTPTSTAAVSNPGHAGALVPATPNIESWGQKCVSWGKKWKGVRYQEVYEQDQQYVSWIAARLSSLTPQMKDFYMYAQSRERLEQGI